MYYLAIDGADTEKITFVNYIIQFITTFSYAPAKTSVGLLVLRIIGPIGHARRGGWRRWFIGGTLILIWMATIVNCIMTYTQCSPAAALWNPSIPHECWNFNVEPHFAIFTSSLNIFADAVLAFVPASLIWNLQPELRKRVSLCILLGLGITAAICGIVKTTYLSELSAHSDTTWQTYDLIVWAGSELFILVFCGSIPMLKPLWDRYIVRHQYTRNTPKGSSNKDDILLKEAARPAHGGRDQDLNRDGLGHQIRRTTEIGVPHGPK